jgi:hypothetical protein
LERLLLKDTWGLEIFPNIKKFLEKNLRRINTDEGADKVLGKIRGNVRHSYITKDLFVRKGGVGDDRKTCSDSFWMDLFSTFPHFETGPEVY